MPSMVPTRLPSSDETGVTQERVGWPSTWTVEAPHCAMPQPYLVPGRLSWSRSAQRSGVSDGPRKSTASPFTVNLGMGGVSLRGQAGAAYYAFGMIRTAYAPQATKQAFPHARR